MPGTSGTLAVRDAAVGEIDRGRRFRGADTPTRTDIGIFEAFDMLAVVMDHRVVQRVDALEIFRIEDVLGADAACRGRSEIEPRIIASPGR